MSSVIVPFWASKPRPIRRYRNIVIKAPCNLRCTYCEVKKARIDVEKTIASVGRIIDRFRPADTLLRVEADGEISLYPPIIDYLAERAVRDGYRIEVLTNGTRLPQCLRDGLRWVISVDGHTAAMNSKRGLKQAQIDVILEHAARLSADLQCVYHGQSVEEMNGFIEALERLSFKGRLHLLPLLALGGRPLEVHLDYAQLRKAPFLERKEYFDRWDHIVKHGRRGDFVCDQIVNGFNYYVSDDHIEMVKCDCYAPPPGYTVKGLHDELEYDNFPCGTCLSHQEFNNRRPSMDL
ncbi:radical SAM protein [Roseateles aquatilis]|uniref:radical SAM protein n=1 Tax=Roseateles aquatilis TaxID=431061 RepID=UPI001130EB62|nr:radical SAM protein [Roseateles aquatilis]